MDVYGAKYKRNQLRQKNMHILRLKKCKHEQFIYFTVCWIHLYKVCAIFRKNNNKWLFNGNSNFYPQHLNAVAINVFQE